MCHDTDARPPLPPIRGGAVDARDLTLTSADGTLFSAYLAVAEHPGGNLVELFDVAAGLTVAGQPEECCLDVGGRDARLRADVRNTLCQGLFDDIEAVVEVVRRRRGGAGEDAAGVVDERQRGLRAAAVDTDIDGHRYRPSVVMG